MTDSIANGQLNGGSFIYVQDGSGDTSNTKAYSTDADSLESIFTALGGIADDGGANQNGSTENNYNLGDSFSNITNFQDRTEAKDSDAECYAYLANKYGYELADEESGTFVKYNYSDGSTTCDVNNADNWTSTEYVRYVKDGDQIKAIKTTISNNGDGTSKETQIYSLQDNLTMVGDASTNTTNSDPSRTVSTMKEVGNDISKLKYNAIETIYNNQKILGDDKLEASLSKQEQISALKNSHININELGNCVDMGDDNVWFYDTNENTYTRVVKDKDGKYWLASVNMSENGYSNDPTCHFKYLKQYSNYDLGSM
ncbi:MAG: hypothetical protein LUG16_02690 [Candidatus Gastranaerophilales bacterium]|nr:hypothetical protein [Candidatus Gastranaerophilales bacterium]